MFLHADHATVDRDALEGLLASRHVFRGRHRRHRRHWCHRCHCRAVLELQRRSGQPLEVYFAWFVSKLQRSFCLELPVVLRVPLGAAQLLGFEDVFVNQPFEAVFPGPLRRRPRTVTCWRRGLLGPGKCVYKVIVLFVLLASGFPGCQAEHQVLLCKGTASGGWCVPVFVVMHTGGRGHCV